MAPLLPGCLYELDAVYPWRVDRTQGYNHILGIQYGLLKDELTGVYPRGVDGTQGTITSQAHNMVFSVLRVNESNS